MQPHEDRDGVMRAIIEGTTDAVFVKDLEGRYLLVNTACARFIGRPPRGIGGGCTRDQRPEWHGPGNGRELQWREVARAGGLLAFALAYRLGARLAGPPLRLRVVRRAELGKRRHAAAIALPGAAVGRLGIALRYI